MGGAGGRMQSIKNLIFLFISFISRVPGPFEQRWLDPPPRKRLHVASVLLDSCSSARPTGAAESALARSTRERRLLRGRARHHHAARQSTPRSQATSRSTKTAASQQEAPYVRLGIRVVASIYIIGKPSPTRRVERHGSCIVRCDAALIGVSTCSVSVR